MKKQLCKLLIIGGLSVTVSAQGTTWWLERPWRMIQTNLREIDAGDFDVDRYVQDIEDYGADVVLINVGGIVANYPSKLPFHYVNPNLKFDLVGQVIERLHKRGIRVIGRFDFSKINEGIAAQHPDWLYKAVAGHVVNYNGQVHTCVNGGYQQKALFDILAEAIDTYPLDGVFFNMPGYKTRDYSHNYHGICQSGACRKRFAAWSGGLSLPVKEDLDDPVFQKYTAFRRETSDELFTRINALIKSKNPNICICTYSDKDVDVRRNESGSQIDDEPEWEFLSTDNVKLAHGSFIDKPVSNTAVHFVSFAFRHVGVSPYHTETRLVENMLNGASLDYYCIGRLDNQEDRAILPCVKKIFQFHKQNESYFNHLRPNANICLVTKSSYLSETSYRGMLRVLCENHLLFDCMHSAVLDSRQTPKLLEDYGIVILPNVIELSDVACQRLDAYVKNGGKLLVTGRTGLRDENGGPRSTFGLASLGVKPGCTVQKQAKGAYVKIMSEDKKRFKPSSFDDLDMAYVFTDFFKCDLQPTAQGLLKFVNPAMFGPPEKCYYTDVTDYPGIIMNRYGKGTSVYFPWQVGRQYNTKGNFGHSRLIMAAIRDLLSHTQHITVETSPLVEVTYQENKNGKFSWIGLTNHSGQIGRAFHSFIPIRGIKVKIQPSHPVKTVKLLHAKKDIPFKQTAEGIECTVDLEDSFDMIVFE